MLSGPRRAQAGSHLPTASARAGTLIRSRQLAIDRGSGERTEIGRVRKAGQLAASPAERFDPEGCNSPEGEWRPGSGRRSWSWKRQRAKSDEVADPGANRRSVAERRAERAAEANRWGAKR
jgi:hypothetical protein